MDSNTRITIDHQEIKNWAEKYHGKPEIVDNLQAGSDPIGLRIDFPGASDDDYLGQAKPAEDINWEYFFQKFDELNLAFEYSVDENIPDPSWVYRFIKRDNIENSK